MMARIGYRPAGHAGSFAAPLAIFEEDFDLTR
jgi:hypothetical protein